MISLGEFLDPGAILRLLRVALRGADRLLRLVGRPGCGLQYPARYLFAFLENHGMLSFAGSPTWRTVVGGSRTYVDRVVKDLSAVATSTPVTAVIAQTDGCRGQDRRRRGDLVRARRGGHACRHGVGPSRQPDPRQRSILGAFQYSRNDTWLHTDTTLLPKAERAQASWNFLLPSCVGPIEHAFVSYDMNRLQGIPSTQTAHRHPQRNGPYRSRAGLGSDDL